MTTAVTIATASVYRLPAQARHDHDHGHDHHHRHQQLMRSPPTPHPVCALPLSTDAAVDACIARAICAHSKLACWPGSLDIKDCHGMSARHKNDRSDHHSPTPHQKLGAFLGFGASCTSGLRLEDRQRAQFFLEKGFLPSS